MLTSLRSIGNSRGVLLPAAFLATCKMQDKIEMQLMGEQIILRPAPQLAAPRQGWFDAVDSGLEHSDTARAQEQEWDSLDVLAAGSKASAAAGDEWVW